jgi:cytochrome c biogenesis protein CcmG, thiol:disulfide interchange protein DsbE
MSSSPPQTPPPPETPPSAILDPAPLPPPGATNGADETTRTIRRLRAVRALLWALVAVMTAVWLLYGGGMDTIASIFQPTPAQVSTADIGQQGPHLRLPLVGGAETDLGAFRGQVIVLNFWATWCEPCKAEMPVFERAQQRYRDRGLTVVGVNFQERDDQITAFLQEVGVTFPSLADRTGEVSRNWRATALPTTFVIDRQGIIRDVRVGAFTDEMLEARLTPLLAQ